MLNWTVCIRFRPASVAVLAAAISVAGVLALAVSADTVAAQSVAPSSGRTVWDRVFSEAQAVRGEEYYRKSCSVCHRNDLTGYESDGPPLRGTDFFVRWRQQTLAEMLGTVQQEMPMSAPGSVPPEQFIDILGFLFKVNGIPLGTTDLPSDPGVLETIMITEKPKP